MSPRIRICRHELARYFPAPVQERFGRAIKQHRLRREIIATATTNSLVNRMGATFVPRAQEETGADPAQIARAYTAAREIFDMRMLWAQIEALDTRVAGEGAILDAVPDEPPAASRDVLAPGAPQVGAARRSGGRGVPQGRAPARSGHLPGPRREASTSASSEPGSSARKRVCRPSLPAASRASMRTTRRSTSSSWPTSHSRGVVEAARVYFDLGTRIGLDWVQEHVEQLPVEGPWQAVARTGLRDSALRIHRRLTEKVLTARARGHGAGARQLPGSRRPARTSLTGSAR